MDKVVIVLALLVIYSSCLNFRLVDDKSFCMRYEGGKNYTLEYVISGNNDLNVLCSITQGDKNVLEKDEVSEYEFTHDYQG